MLWRKIITRHIFAEIEAKIHSLGQLYLSFYKAGVADLELGEFYILSQKQFRLNPKGMVETSNLLLKSAEHFMLVTRLYSERYPESLSMKQDSQEWMKYKVAIKVRDRITHPKDSSDLDISAEEYATVVDVSNWVDSWFASLGAAIDHMGAKVASKIGLAEANKD